MVDLTVEDDSPSFSAPRNSMSFSQGSANSDADSILLTQPETRKSEASSIKELQLAIPPGEDRHLSKFNKQGKRTSVVWKYAMADPFKGICK